MLNKVEYSCVELFSVSVSATEFLHKVGQVKKMSEVSPVCSTFSE